jgi:hypothetical protein
MRNRRSARRPITSDGYGRAPNLRRGRLTVEELMADALDVSDLHRVGAFRDGDWALPLAGLRYPEITKLRTSEYQIELELRGHITPQVIPISWSPCNFGNARPWLHCPSCRRRVAKLFKGLAGYFCRQCLGNPMYACQAKSTKGRRHFEACKLRLRLGGIASVNASLPERPRGMHKKTYARLRKRIDDLERDLSGYFKAKPADYAALGCYLP